MFDMLKRHAISYFEYKNNEQVEVKWSHIH